MVSQAYRDILTGGTWARDAAANRQTPTQLGITRANGYTIAYEQIGSGSEPERTGFNQREYERTAAVIDMANTGVPAYDAAVDYRPETGAACFVTTPTGLWLTFQNVGPAFGNVTDPDSVGQTVWRRY